MAKGPLYGALPILHETVIAESAIPKYRCTMRGAIDTATQGKTAKLPTGATAPFFGVNNNLIDAAAGEGIHLIITGRAIGTANAAITRGQRLIMDVNGRLGPAADVVAEQVIGIAEEAAAALDDLFSFTITNYVR